MWANDFRFSSHRSHFCALRPMLKERFSTFRLCHATPTGSGTSPNILRDIRLTIAPYQPVSSALGVLGLLGLMSPPINCSRHRDTGHVSNVTHPRRILLSAVVKQSSATPTSSRPVRTTRR